MISGRPIAMAIEQCADDAAIQNALKRFVFFLRLPLGDDFAVFWETPDMQSVRVGRTTAPAGIVQSVFFLERLLQLRRVTRFCQTSQDTDAIYVQRKVSAAESSD